jgi:hypothetical protein
MIKNYSEDVSFGESAHDHLSNKIWVRVVELSRHAK